MPRNGLTKERVVEAAAQLIERAGAEDFSMRALAESLNIKTASLYNHVKSMEALLTDVCIYALRLQRESELRAIEGKDGAEGIRALANAYRAFTKEHRELYRLTMRMAVACGERLSEVSQCIVEPFLLALRYTNLTESEKVHWQRVLRGMLHGFAAQEDAGFFAHLPEDEDTSFRIAIQCYIDGLEQAKKDNRKEESK